MNAARLRGILLASFLFTSTVFAAGPQVLHGHMPAALAHLQPLRDVSPTNRLSLAIALPLRNQTELSNLLNQIYDPTSPNYHHYLTPAQFAAEFGPAEQDYQTVQAFAQANGLQVTRTYPNRGLVDVQGSVRDIERTLHIALNVYQHPTENRTFYAPSTEPSLDLSVPILHISGLDNYGLPRPRLIANKIENGQNASPNAGSGPGGTYSGKDFRTAYVPDSTLNGSGQIVGLFELDGYSASDITYYQNNAGLPNIPLQNVLIDGASGLPDGSGGVVEVDLDIEVAMAMAPNLSKVVVFIAPNAGNPFVDIFNSMVSSNQIQQFSCSWYVPGGTAEPAADQAWQQMAAQGQSFFNASGDSDAWTGLISFPGDSPYITQVGGTTLTTSGPNGAWVSEKVWNVGNGVGSSGGISTQYPIPAWQTNISMTANQGSTTKRNTPDVALTAQNVYVRASGNNYNVGGTSCAAPLWAGFAALVNQQAVASGEATIGFINPLLDTIGTSQSYTTAFHDITTGNNTWSGSPTKFSAVAGYDLCTGWGTPAGQALINALANPEPLIITPTTGFVSIGGVGGPFTITSENFALTNGGTNTISWTLSNTSTWLNVSSSSGTLSSGGPSTGVTVSLNTSASNLAVGTYTATLWFTNVNDGLGQSRQFGLSVIAPPTITVQPANEAVVEGTTASFVVNATGGLPLAYQSQCNGTNLSDGGNIFGSATTSLMVSNVSIANTGNYSVIVTNLAGTTTSSNVALTLMPSAPIITRQPANQTTTVGKSAGFSVSVIGTTPYYYQWNFNGTNITDATNSTLILTGVQQTQSGNYAVLVTNSVGSTLSSNANLTVYPAAISFFFDDFNGPALNGIWQTNLPNAYCGSFPNGSAEIASYAGAPNYSFGTLNTITVLNMNDNIGPLQRCGWSTITYFAVNNFRYEARFNTLTISPTNSIDGFFEIWILNATNNNLYDIVSPFAGGFGSDLYMFFGSSVDGTYTKNSYTFANNTWYRLVLECLPGQNMHAALCDDNDNELIGYTFNHDASVYGPGFQLALSQAVGASGTPHPSAVAVDYVSLVSGFPPVITTQPKSQMAVTGTNVTFTVGASGTLPLNYQWNFNGAGIPGATNSTLTLSNVQSSATGNYFVVVTNVYGSVTSSNAALVVGTPPTITAQPINQTVLQGTTASFNVTASGDVPLNYQWTFNGANISGATNSTLTLTNTLLSQAGNYAVLVTNTFGSVTSTNAALTILVPAAITKQPTNQMVVIGGTATFSVQATGTTNLIYQWSFNSTNIAGATNAALVLSNVQLSQSGTYAVLVTNLYGSILSSNAVLTVYGIAPFITTPPSTQVTTVGGGASFTVTAGGTLPLNYQWIANGTNISGATNSSLVLTNVQFSQAGSYSVFITNLYGSTNSTSAPLTVNAALPALFYDGFDGPALNPIWQTNLPSSAYCGSFPFGSAQTATYLGAPTYSFGMLNSNSVLSLNDSLGQLQRRGWNTSSNFFANNFRYEVRFNSLFLSQTSSIDGFVEMWIMNATNNNLYDIVSPFAGGYGSDLYMFFGSSVDNNYVKGSYVYANNTWYRLVLQCLPGQNIRASLCDDNENELIGQTFNHSSASFGSGFKLVISQTVGFSGGTYPTTVAADYANLTTQFSPIVITQPQNQFVANGANASFSVVAEGGSTLGYQWNFNGTNILGATNSTLSLTNVQPFNAGAYSVIVTNSFGSVTSSNAALTTPGAPTIAIQPTNQTVSAASTATFSVTAGGTSPFYYQWLFNSSTPVPGATNSVLILTNIQVANQGAYSVVVTNAYGSVTSSNALLIVTVDHFAWATVPSPRFMNAPFPVQITAQDAANGVFTNYTGIVFISATNGIPVSPTASSNFVQGVWTGTIAVSQVANNVVLSASDGSGHSGLANPISVAAWPQLATVPSGGTMFISWPINPAGFVLETSTNLATGNWVPVSTAPLQFGGQNVEPIMTGTNTSSFYRLQYNGP